VLESIKMTSLWYKEFYENKDNIEKFTIQQLNDWRNVL
jgi:hypothetical protein